MLLNQQDRTVGTLIAHLVHVLAIQKQWSKSFTTEYIATATGFGPDIVYKWRQNRVTPSEETVTTLVQLGHQEAQLDREWASELVWAARYFELMALVDQLWQPEVEQLIPHNLPKPTYTEFVGRHVERNRLLALLGTASAAPLIMVDGIGGVGKTALVLKVAYQCLEASCRASEFVDTPTFAVIIFVSAKQKYLTADGILPRAYAPDTLRAIYREIAYVLDLDVTRIVPDELPSHIRHTLARQRTLLIVDNLETVEDKDRVLAFLYDLPAQVKVVITTREQRYYTPIQLTALAEPEGTCLIELEAAKQQLQLSSTDVNRLYAGTGGIPAAITYGVGQLAAGRDLSNVLQRMADHDGDVARFFFHDSVAPLRGHAAHHLLMAIALFTQSPQAGLVFRVADLADDPQRANEAEVRLIRLSLIHKAEQQFVIHPLTREYTLAELATHVEFERGARQRWVQAYCQFVTEVDDGRWEWYQGYQSLEEEWENLEAVIHWCMHQQRYADVVHLWQHIKEYTWSYGTMTERLAILHWLIQAAERHGDRGTQVQALGDRALTLMGLGTDEQLDAAEHCLTEAWVLRHDVCPTTQSTIADTFANYYIQRQQFKEAAAWLEISTALVTQMATIGVNRSETQECKAAATCYLQARLLRKSGGLTEAQHLLIQIQKRSQELGLSRLYYDAQYDLATIALARNELATAETLLLDGLRIVERNQDRRRTACYKKAMALLAQKHAQPVVACRWANEAYTIFDTLGMQSDKEVVHQIQLQLAGT